MYISAMLAAFLDAFSRGPSALHGKSPFRATAPPFSLPFRKARAEIKEMLTFFSFFKHFFEADENEKDRR